MRGKFAAEMRTIEALFIASMRPAHYAREVVEAGK